MAAACMNVARQFGLLFAGIDLKETAEGDYYCFEINPSPAFLVYEQLSGQPISRALAELLHGVSPSAPAERRMSPYEHGIKIDTLVGHLTWLVLPVEICCSPFCFLTSIGDLVLNALTLRRIHEGQAITRAETELHPTK